MAAQEYLLNLGPSAGSVAGTRPRAYWRSWERTAGRRLLRRHRLGFLGVVSAVNDEGVGLVEEVEDAEAVGVFEEIHQVRPTSVGCANEAEFDHLKEEL